MNVEKIVDEASKTYEAVVSYNCVTEVHRAKCPIQAAIVAALREMANDKTIPGYDGGLSGDVCTGTILEELANEIEAHK